MSVKQHAQNILDICERGPIPGGLSIKIQTEARAIIRDLERPPVVIIKRMTEADRRKLNGMLSESGGYILNGEPQL